MYGGIIPFCAFCFSSLEFGKNANSNLMKSKNASALLSFVQRQSEFAFFGALTAVDALFYCNGRTKI